MKKIFIIIIFIIFIIPNYSYGFDNYFQANNYLQLGNDSFNSKKYKSAIKNYDCAIFLGINDSDVYNYRGLAKYHIKDFKNAIKDFNIAISLQNDVYYYSNRGNAKFELKDYNGAIQDYSYAIELNPTDSSLYFNRGTAYHNIKKYIKALNDYNCSYMIKNNKETRKRILKIKQNFKDFNFLINNSKYIIQEIEIHNFLLFIILLYFNFVVIEEKKVNFKKYTDKQIKEYYNIEEITLDSQYPQPEIFGLKSNRIDYIEKCYDNCHYPYPQDNSGFITCCAIFPSLFLINFMNTIYQIYINKNISIETDSVFCFEFLILYILSYRAIKNISKILKSEPQLLPKECNYYLLYKGACKLYEQKIICLNNEKENREKSIQLKTQQKNNKIDNCKNNWLILRENIIESNGKKCAICGAITNIEIHHKIPLAKGGTNCIENLIPICHKCHEKIHNFKMDKSNLGNEIDAEYGYKISKKKKSFIGYMICEAITNHSKIKIKYKSYKFNNVEITERIIRPIKIELGYECKNEFVQISKFNNNKVFIRAFCELRNAERIFRLDRILYVSKIK